MNFFKEQLSQEELTNIALVGVGNLGQALLNYNFRKDNSMRISAGFDVNPGLIDTILEGVPIYDVKDLVAQVSDQKINVAILAVPSDHAQDMTDKLVEAGVKGILNFTPLRVTVPPGVRVHNVDLANELQALIYFISHYTDTDQEASMDEE